MFIAAGRMFLAFLLAKRVFVKREQAFRNLPPTEVRCSRKGYRKVYFKEQPLRMQLKSTVVLIHKRLQSLSFSLNRFRYIRKCTNATRGIYLGLFTIIFFLFFDLFLLFLLNKIRLIFELIVRDKLVVTCRFVDSSNTFPIPSVYLLECLCYLLPSASTKKQLVFLSINSLLCKSYASKCKSSKTKIECSSDTFTPLNILLISVL